MRQRRPRQDPCIYCYGPADGRVNSDGEPICPACIARFSGRGRYDRIARYAAAIAKHYPDSVGRAVDDVIAIADDELARQASGQVSSEGAHHPKCFQSRGVPADLLDEALGAGLCDCRTLYLIEGHKKATPADVTKNQLRPCAGNPGYCTRHECPGGCRAPVVPNAGTGPR